VEEEEVKDIWNAGDDDGSFNYSEQSIQKMISQGSGNIISKFIKTLKFEKWTNLIVLSFISLMCIAENSWWCATSMLVINAFLYWYYHNLIGQLQKEYIDSNVIQYLSDVYRIIKRFILHYKVAVVPAGVFGFFVSLYAFDFPIYDLFIYEDMSLVRLFWVIATIIVTVATAFGVIHLMYGKKALRIKEMLDSLKKEESNSGL
jgi:hypothetical protein